MLKLAILYFLIGLTTILLAANDIAGIGMEDGKKVLFISLVMTFICFIVAMIRMSDQMSKDPNRKYSVREPASRARAERKYSENETLKKYVNEFKDTPVWLVFENSKMVEAKLALATSALHRIKDRLNASGDDELALEIDEALSGMDGVKIKKVL